jgi:O-antigen/teichoic acid export membrane protein
VQFFIALWLFGVRQQNIRFVFSKEDFIKLALFGYPLVFHQLGKFVINQSDRLFIAKMISIDEAGIYSIGYQVGVMLLLPITAFSNFYSPFIYERLSKITEHAKVQIVKTGYAFIILIIVCFAALVLLAPYFFELFIDQKFHKGLQYVFWVALSYVFWGFYLLLTPIVFYQGKTMFLGFLSLLNIALNCLFNYVFINAFGAIGAAYGTTLSFLIVFLVIAAYSSFLLPLPWLRPRVRESNSN